MTGAGIGKEIRKLKIAASSACTLRCSYCFVDKSSGESIRPDSARAALRGFLDAPGSLKELEIYGGEPFLQFARVRDMLEFSFSEAWVRGKRLMAAVATNGVRIDPEHLDFLRDRHARLYVSFSGGHATHDRYRRFSGGAGSYGRIAANLPLLFSRLEPERVGAIFCIHPGGVGAMAEDFIQLADLGFEHIVLEVIHGFPWTDAARKGFLEGLQNIGESVLRRIRGGRPVYLETFFDFLDRDLKRKDMCMFYRELEVFPGGEYSFYPYPFVSGSAQRKRIAVGSVGEGFCGRYRSCRYDPHARRCMECRARYYVLRRIAQGNEPYSERTAFQAALMGRIVTESKHDPRFRSYLREMAARWRRRYIGEPCPASPC